MFLAVDVSLPGLQRYLVVRLRFQLTVQRGIHVNMHMVSDHTIKKSTILPGNISHLPPATRALRFIESCLLFSLGFIINT